MKHRYDIGDLVSYTIIVAILLGALAPVGSNVAFGGNIYDDQEQYIGRSDSDGFIFDRLERNIGRVERNCND